MMILSRILKAILLFTLLLVLAFTLLWATISWMNWSEHKSLFISLVESRAEFQISQLDDVGINAGFPTEIELANVKLDWPDASSTMSSLAADKLVLRFDPLSLLLQDRTHYQHIELNSGRVVARKQGQSDKEEEDSSLPYIESLHISDTDIKYRTRRELEHWTQGHIATLDLSATGTDKPMMLEATGRLGELSVKIQGETGSIAALDSGQEAFPIDLQISVDADQFSVTGKWPQNAKENTFKLDVSANGDHIAEIAQAFGVALQRVPPYKLSFLVTGSDGEISIADLQATLGYSYVYGTAMLEAGETETFLTADLGASLLRRQDISSLLPQDKDNEDQTDTSAGLLSRNTFTLDIPYLTGFDMELAVNEYQGRHLAKLLRSFNMSADLEKSALTFRLNEASFADGIVEGSVRMEDHTDTMDATAHLSAKTLQLPDLVSAFLTPEKRAKVNPSKTIAGKITTDLDLRGAGASPQALGSDLKGEIGIAMEEGAMTEEAIEALGLEMTDRAVTWLGQTSLKDINCLLGVFDIESGVIKSKTLVLASHDAIIVGKGEIDLNNETLDLTFEAHAKDFSFPATQSPVQIAGSFTDIKVDVVTQELVARLAGAALVTLIEPAVALVPLLEFGLTESGRCKKLSSTLQRIQREAEREI